MIISISGLDGSGKSTQIELLFKYFDDKGIKCGTRHLIKDSLTYFMTHRVIGSFSKRTKLKVEEGIRTKKKSSSFYLLAFIKKILLFFELFYFNLRYGSLKKKHKNVLVCDRYFYDALIQTEYLGVSGDLFKKIYGRFIILPDIALLLKTDPVEAYNRKKEFDVSYFITKDQLYSKMAEEKGTVVIPPGSIEGTFKNIISAVQEKAQC